MYEYVLNANQNQTYHNSHFSSLVQCTRCQCVFATWLYI